MAANREVAQAFTIHKGLSKCASQTVLTNGSNSVCSRLNAVLCQHLAEKRVQLSVIYRLFSVGGKCRQFATQQAYSVVMAAATVARRRHRKARPVPEYFEFI